MVRPRSLVGLVLLFLVALGCGGGGSSRVKLVSEVVWTLPEAVWNEIPAGDRQDMLKRGIQFENPTRTLRFPQTRFHTLLRVGERLYPVPANGEIDLPEIPAGVTEASVISSPSNPTPLHTFPIAQLVAGVTIVVPINYHGPLGMNSPDDTVPGGRHLHSRDEDNGTTTCPPGTKSPCCEDQNGALGDGRRYNNGWKRYRNFIGSTCFQWVLAGCCANEGAEIIPALFGSYISCYDNHKSRNCQDLKDDDFAVSATEIVVQCGQQARLTVTNGTCSNESIVLTLSNFVGQVKGDEDYGPGSQLIRHYDSATPRVNHLRDREFFYIAPVALPEGVTELKTSFMCVTAGQVRVVDVTVRCVPQPTPTPAPTPTPQPNRAPRLLRFTNTFLPDLHSNAFKTEAEDPEGDTLTYTWSWSGPATSCGRDSGAGADGTRSRVYNHDGCSGTQEATTKVKVVVRDSKGAEATYEHLLRNEGSFDLNF
ncbi:hypothetical protein [Armatimonas sp.]|uniref:hypothetical protein n=1 Tax=Armatimonas sp. TaxID=1872638 RepID=UPI003752E096